MKKRVLAVFLSAVMLLAASGCGSSQTQKVGYAFVTNSQGLTDQAASEIWTGIETYVSGRTAAAGRFISKSDDADGYKKAVDDAVKAEAKTLVFVGADMEGAAYAAQKAYGKTKIILIGGEPKEKTDGKSEVGENTLCVTYALNQASFLAGYGSIAEGYRNLGYMAGVKTDEAVQYEAGFVSGAEAAASDLGLAAGSVSIRVYYAGSDELTPKRMGTALDMYSAGCEIIMTCGDNIRKAVVKAAETCGKYIISADTDARSESGTIRMGTRTDGASAVAAALKESDAEDFKGGSTTAYGLKQDSVGLAIDFSTFTGFTEDMYKAEAAKLADGTVTASGEEQTAGSNEVNVEMMQS